MAAPRRSTDTADSIERGDFEAIPEAFALRRRQQGAEEQGEDDLELPIGPFGRRSAPAHSRPFHQAQENGRATPPLAWRAPIPNATRSEETVLAAFVQAARSDLFATLHRRKEPGKPKVATVNLATAQRLVLSSLQLDMMDEISKILDPATSFAAMEDVQDELGDMLRRYCQGIRDLEYMQDCAARHEGDDEHDPFYLKSSRFLNRVAMENKSLIPKFQNPKGLLPQPLDFDHPQLPGVARSAANKVAKGKRFLRRLVMASVGGLFLIVPVIIMSMVPGRTASLVTTCVAMLFFAIGVTWKTELAEDQVLAATAAYAAVLVVFVGTSLADTSAKTSS